MRTSKGYMYFTKPNYAKLKPLLMQNKIDFEPKNNGNLVYIGLNVNDNEFKLVNLLLK